MNKPGQLNRLILDEDKDDLWEMLAAEGLELDSAGLEVVADFIIRSFDDGYKMGREIGWERGWSAGYRDAPAFTTLPGSRKAGTEH